MDAVGVAGARLVSPWAMYRFDASYALIVHAQHPTRFGLIKPFDPEAADVGEQVTAWARQPGTVGARIMLGAPASDDASPQGLDAICRAAAVAGLPVNVLCWGNIQRFSELVRRHPDTQFVVDHVGIVQPFSPPPPQTPFADLPAVLTLAKFEHVAIKISGACTLSHEGFPFSDIFDPLARVFDAFGFERCLWGSDWTRAVELIDYEQAVAAFRISERLSAADRHWLMGGALAQIYQWSPG